jgi:hypothetical protein
MFLHKIHLFTQKVDNTTMEKLSEASDLLVRAALLASGHRQHNRGEWRLRREPKESP